MVNLEIQQYRANCEIPHRLQNCQCDRSLNLNKLTYNHVNNYRTEEGSSKRIAKTHYKAVGAKYDSTLFFLEKINPIFMTSNLYFISQTND
jgi:hypothetical protein